MSDAVAAEQNMSYFEAMVLSASSSDDENVLVDRRELGLCGQASWPPLIRIQNCYSGLGAEVGWQKISCIITDCDFCTVRAGVS